MTTNMNMTGMNNMTNTNAMPQLTTDNLKVLKDQIHCEALMNKKANQYAQYCTDPNLKNVCTQVANAHKQNFTALKTYLDSHQ